jgi:hypothetical protein
LWPRADYRLLEDPDVIARFRADPRAFLDGVRPPAILDEAQNVPEVFPFVRAVIDRQTGRKGQRFLTGSQDLGLMRGTTESMAGRAAVLQLWPMSSRETAKVDLLRSGYPEVLARPGTVSLWFSSYLQTYIERDVRAISAIQDLVAFRRFLALVASRHGQVLNKSDLAAPLGMSVPGVGKWLDILEMTEQILVVPPYFENCGKRLITSPKVYIADSGLACHLLGIETESELARSPFLGALFEGLVASEIVKTQVHAGRRRELYHFRDQQGPKVDFIAPGRGGRLAWLEVKASGTVAPRMADSMARLAAALRKGARRSHAPDMFVVYRPTRSSPESSAVAPGVQAVSWRDLPLA